ncbi:Gp15 family bacteriophage protein [Companilactobacillus suantsaicola]|uniref:Gp15 family bacteriophage protein n=1 Tax=Companilactobacillus suantsaicola TaxID=2487723 RepID=UPI00070EF885|nr:MULTISPECIES: Gp15 family bacteriophage protein [Companilactobacillus]
MLSLTNGLDDRVSTEIGDLKVNLSFNNVLKWYELLDKNDVALTKKLVIGWNIFLGADTLSFNDMEDYEVSADALKKITEYISQDPYQPESQIGIGNNQPNIEPTKWFSYQQDAEAIYASFLFDYGIDLIDSIDKMRWEKFRALFNNLSSKSPIMRIIDIRQANILDYQGQALADLTRAQEYYSLEDSSVDTLNQQVGDMFTMLKGMAEQK